VALAGWKHQVDEFTTQQRNLRSLKASLIESLDPASKVAIMDPLTGFLQLSVRDILDQMEIIHGVMTASDIQHLKVQVTKRFEEGNSLREFVSNKNRAFALLAAAGQAEPELSKVEILMNSLRVSKTFSRRLDLWSSMNPDLPQQTFDLLATAMILWYDSRPRAKGPTVLMAHLAEEKIPDEPKKARSRSPGTLFCWTHGMCFHDSATCRPQTRKPGHQIGATAANKMDSTA
jgi:hypothetical protein